MEIIELLAKAGLYGMLSGCLSAFISYTIIKTTKEFLFISFAFSFVTCMLLYLAYPWVRIL